MINVDTRFLKLVDESEMWLILHLLDKADPSSMTCFPGNEGLCRSAKWNIKKLQKVKGSLIEKKLLLVSNRTGSRGQTSNLYKINSDLLGIYVPAKNIKFEDTPKADMLKRGMAPTPKADNEVLTNEVLVNVGDSKESPQTEEKFPDGLFDDMAAEPQRSKKKKADECFVPFKKLWQEAYPVLALKFASVDGKMINEIIVSARAYAISENEAPTVEALCGLFGYVISYVKANSKAYHYVDGQPLTSWNKYFLSIINESKSGKKREQGKSTRQTERDILRNL